MTNVSGLDLCSSWFFYILLLFHVDLAGFKELELYKEELLSKPALLVVNKMDLPDAQDKLAELKEQLEKPHGKLAGFLFFFFY